MKKFLIACALSLLAGTSFAASLTGTISDVLTGEDISENKISVTLGTNPENSATSNSFGFKIENFNPTDGLTLSFRKPGKYIKLEGKLIVTDNILRGFAVYEDNEWIRSLLIDPDPDNAGDYILNINLFPETSEIIRGKIVAKQDGSSQIIEPENVKIRVLGDHTEFFPKPKITKGEGNELEYVIKGYLGESGIPREYNVKFEYSSYQPITKKFKVENSIFTNEEKTTVTFDLPSIEAEEQQNIEDMTGFECEELLPKYLVGASCVENKELKGDASDLALWIQKFGGKITSMIGIIAVVLIVWNAFNLVTAAGDTDKITQGKNGIIWTIVGLVLTMFAYVIVKTVIVLTYT
jgi:hypothetical protein